MDVLLIVDLEGISGIETVEDLEHGTEAFRRSCERMAEDVDAAAAGAFEGGAARLTAWIWHGVRGGVTADMLDPRVELAHGRTRDALSIMQSGYDAALLVGAHAMAGATGGFISHTRDVREWHDFVVGGRRFGEIGLMAALLGSLNVPLVLVTGDEAACGEAHAFVSPVETVAVKRALSWSRAEVSSEAEARKAIRAGAARAMSLVGVAPPLRLDYPTEVVLELSRADFCEKIVARNPGIERVDARTVRTTAREARDLLL